MSDRFGSRQAYGNICFIIVEVTLLYIALSYCASALIAYYFFFYMESPKRFNIRNEDSVLTNGSKLAIVGFKALGFIIFMCLFSIIRTKRLKID